MAYNKARTTKDAVYLKNRAQAFANSDVCWLCGQWIDMELPWPDPWSKSADHVVPISRGGDNRGEVRAAHLRCNRRRGRTMPPVPHGRAW
jgi:hypothetical protein